MSLKPRQSTSIGSLCNSVSVDLTQLSHAMVAMNMNLILIIFPM